MLIRSTHIDESLFYVYLVVHIHACPCSRVDVRESTFACPYSGCRCSGCPCCKDSFAFTYGRVRSIGYPLSIWV